MIKCLRHPRQNENLVPRLLELLTIGMYRVDAEQRGSDQPRRVANENGHGYFSVNTVLKRIPQHDFVSQLRRACKKLRTGESTVSASTGDTVSVEDQVSE